MASAPAQVKTARSLILGVSAVVLAGLIVINGVRGARDESTPASSMSTTAARSVVRSDPLDVVALRNYGLSLDRSGRATDAEAVFGFVLMRSWRDIPTMIWLIPRRISQGDYTNALAQADALMRRDIDNDLRERLITLLSAAASDDSARPALVARLNARPWWRDSFLPRLAQNGPLPGVRAVLLAMARGPAPASALETAPYLQRLVDAARYAQALSDWEALHAGDAGVRSLVHDGDFANAPDPSVFGWRAARGVGGESAVEPAPDGRAGAALRVDYDGFSSPTLPRQLLILAPGRYQLSWQERRDPDTQRRLDWTVACAGNASVISAAVTQGGGADWRGMSKTVVVPPSGCDGQWLSVVASPGERREPVTAWYAHITLTPLG